MDEATSIEHRQQLVLLVVQPKHTAYYVEIHTIAVAWAPNYFGSDLVKLWLD